MNSRRKGKVGELSACQELRDMFGWQCRRTQQHSGWTDGNSPDIEVDDTPDLFWEIKRVEKLNIPRALATAVRQCGRRCPVLMHRPNRSVNGWMLTVRLQDLARLVHAYQRALDEEAAPVAAVASQRVSATPASDSEGVTRAARAARSV